MKAAASVTDADFRGPRKLQTVAGKCFACGVVPNDGGATVQFDDRVFAVPGGSLWQGR